MSANPEDAGRTVFTNFGDIIRFHEKFGLTYKGEPRMLHKELSDFRIGFLEEELIEYVQAVAKKDMAGAFDALIDLVYVAMGTAYLHGFPWQRGWEEVQKANMAKVRVYHASESKRGSTFDVRKPDGWTPPDIDHVLNMAKLGRR